MDNKEIDKKDLDNKNLSNKDYENNVIDNKEIDIKAIDIKAIDSTNIALLIEYDGANYCGWQSQINAPTIQEEMRKAIFNLTGKNVLLTGCSRTDSGVHAKGHVSNFHIKTTIPMERFSLALNSFLPPEISVKKAAIVKADFNSRFDTIGKQYCYTIWNEETRPALLRNFSCHIPKHLNIDLMKLAAEMLVGKYDFATFMASGSVVKTTIRTIYSIRIETKGNVIFMRFHGSGFLYNMVRILAGTLVYVGAGKIDPSQIPYIIESKNRRLAGKTLPANGLMLEEVFYQEEIFGYNNK